MLLSFAYLVYQPYNALLKMNWGRGRRADKSAMGAMNRPLRGFAALHSPP
jgi:hypothetical protein